ncbi:hypothetical protein GCM10008967_18000 [Bacillus carboniphilus]|uniref:Thioredoxin domain-containing protein n=1 Tax=Bacillus carboniphilus TaxID=86663 RepID=A0ABN0W8J5_9BACI
MKKVVIFLAVIVLLFGGMIVLNNMQNAAKMKNNPYGTDELKQSTIDQFDDPLYTTNIILPEELEEKLANGEDVTVYFFSPECGYCKEATPIVSPLAEDLGVEMVKYNVLEFEQAWPKYGLEATPTIIKFKDGQEYQRITGLFDKEIYEKWFELDREEFQAWYEENKNS